MLHRPYWVKSDSILAWLRRYSIRVNVWRVFPHTFMPESYMGKLRQTNTRRRRVVSQSSCARSILERDHLFRCGHGMRDHFVQVCLVRRDQRDQHKAELKVASMS